MDFHMCGYNGFSQLNFENINLEQHPIESKQKDKECNDTKYAFDSPTISFTSSNAVNIEDIHIYFTWSRCIASVKIEDRPITLVAGEHDVVALDNLSCTAVLAESILLKEKDNASGIKGLHFGSDQPFPVAVRSDDNEASSVNLSHTAGGCKDFFSVYSGVSFGKFKLSEDKNANSPSAANLNIKICHIDFVPPIKEISCGKEHVLLLTQSGSVYSYGLSSLQNIESMPVQDNFFTFLIKSSRGQLGHGEIEKESSPRLIDALDGLPMKSVAAGGWHSAAVSAIGDVYVWGWNESGQVGLGSIQEGEKSLNSTRRDEDVGIVALPACIDVPGGENIQDVACGSRHTVFLSELGRIFTCGWNRYGQLGVGDTKDRRTLTAVNGLTACRVFAGHWNSAFLCKQDCLLNKTKT